MQGIFNFINKSPAISEKPAKRTFPSKLYGISQQSPTEFKLSHTLVNLDGYLYKQPIDANFSQLRYNSVVGNSHLPTTFSTQHKKRLDMNEFCFKRKKGLLSQFLDNHAWKKKVIPLLGVERNEEGRSLRNSEYEKSREESSLKRSSLHNIRYHYSQRKPEKLSSQRKFMQEDTTLSVAKPKHHLPHAYRLNAIQTFQKYISKTPNPFRSKLTSNGTSFELEREEKEKSPDIYLSFNATNKSKFKSTYEVSEEIQRQGEGGEKNRKNSLLHRSLFYESRKLQRGGIRSEDKKFK